MYFVYVIRSVGSGRYYVGYTNNLARRLDQHNANKTKSLVNKGPFEFVYTENYLSLADAVRRESQVKSYKGGVAFKKLIGILK